ncbi:uncharacterized protein J7T54_002245 [Emericellopsis cladophorae]|uniref:Uncharacterized protein n=1 Tax=Emericellopsis cladophorae TaxID=2686198 RepID=A0A9P9Y1D2_9HYPO|nr:uncharacterized protein J7T54_002245 [Emericellopsis cladophorae]KAI6781353.1 hypothetical protein J7T54_002245 [Emericellopsis cladophorae]
MDTPERAKAMMEPVVKSELDPSRNSRIIANNILTAQVNVPPLYASREYLRFIAYAHEMVRSQHLGGIGHSSKFEFQYTPAIGKMTEMSVFGPSGSPMRSIKTVIATLMVLMALLLVSNLLYPWKKIAARRLGELARPGEQGLQGLL